jgi:putative (di)nucleoside polyphosphate hydrolase
MNSPISALKNVLPYRLGVGIMLINPEGLIWIGRRVMNADEASNWQMPQGGMNPTEDPATAALRELAEETGVDQVEIIAQTQGWLHYDLPPEAMGHALHGRYCGQKQRWFAMRYLGRDEDFNIHIPPPGGHTPEFDAWRWAPAEEVVRLIIDFKRPVYEAVVREFSALLG